MKVNIGKGTLSFVFCLAGIIFSCSFNHFTLGDVVLNFFGLKTWSNGSHGFHLTLYYSCVFFIISYYFGRTYNTHLLANIGKVTSVFWLVIIFTLALTNTAQFILI